MKVSHGGTAPERRRMYIALIWRGALLALLWWLLTEGRGDAWGLGLVAVAAAVWASLALAPPVPGGLSMTGLLGFVAHFILHSVRGGVQVALLALGPRRTLAPAMFDVELALAPGLPRVLMANAASLMPGTVSVHLDGARLRVHALDRRQDIRRELRALERRVASVFRGA